MKAYFLIALLAFSPLAPTPAFAAEGFAAEGFNRQQMDDAARAMEEAVQNLTRILSMVLRSIPQFEAPVILPNGDILIRRVHKQQNEENKPVGGSKI
ncbi:MAG: hypothetical protein JKY92_02715 [Magnetovibrio sp.]|nr:hypothetical protein [Magnetovibrio sp.]